MKSLLVNLFLIFIPISSILSQQISWNHLNGPMGSIVGDLGITTKGDIYSGVYPFWNIYSGLFKSTDNGDSWGKVITSFNDFEVYAIYITKEDHIWVGTNFQDRIYRSTDDGLTWEIKRNGYNTGECWAFGQSKDGVMFAGDGQYQYTYRSTDYGENWEFSAYLRPLVFATDSSNIVYAGTHDGLFGTTDNGINWAQNNFLANIAVSSILIDSSNNIYCGTGYYDDGNGVFYSSDGGQNWTQLGLAGKAVLSLAFDSYGNLLAGTLKDGLFKTTDMGKTWTQHQNGLYRKQVFRLKMNDNDDIFIGSEDEGIFRSVNNGESFEQIGLPTSKVNNFVFSGDSLIFSSTPSGVQKYNRLTKKWTNLGLHQVEAISISPSNYLFAATFDEGLCKSTDFGATWSSIYFSADTLMPVYNVLAINDDTLFCATYPDLFRSIDAGVTWTATNLGTGFWTRDLFLYKNNLWVRGFDLDNNLYRSTNFGETFEIMKTGIGDLMRINSIVQVENGYVFFTDPNDQNGLFRSTDLGQNWSQILFNKYPVAVYADDIGTVISGWDSVYLSSNFGDTWVTIPHPFGDRNYFTDIKKDFSGKMFCGTLGTGVYQFDIITSIDDNSESIITYELIQNYPNPFNPSTVINYSIKNAGLVKIKVFDILGSEIVNLVNETKNIGYYSVKFNASALPSGVYIYTMQVNGYYASRKMLLLK